MGNDMIFEGNYPQDGKLVTLKEPFKIELKGVPGQTIIKTVIKEGSKGTVIRNFGWYLSIAFNGYEVEIYDLETYNKHIEWINNFLP